MRLTYLLCDGARFDFQFPNFKVGLLLQVSTVVSSPHMALNPIFDCLSTISNGATKHESCRRMATGLQPKLLVYFAPESQLPRHVQEQRAIGAHVDRGSHHARDRVDWQTGMRARVQRAVAERLDGAARNGLIGGIRNDPSPFSSPM